MSISKKPLKKTAGEEEGNFSAPMAQIFEDVDNEDGGTLSPEDDRVAKLEERFAALQTQLDEANRTNMALLQGGGQQFNSQVQDTFVPEKIEFPDPALDPDGYASAVSRKAQQDVQIQTRKTQTEQQRKQDLDAKVKDLWEDFGDAFPEYAQDQEKVEFAASQVIKKAQRRGINAERYMFVTTDQFIADVGKQMEKTFGKTEEVEDDEPAPRARAATARKPARDNSRRRRVEEDDDGGDRTSGIFGGMESGGRPNKVSREDEQSSMIDDIQLIQRKTGFW